MLPAAGLSSSPIRSPIRNRRVYQLSYLVKESAQNVTKPLNLKWAGYLPLGALCILKRLDGVVELPVSDNATISPVEFH